MSIPNFKHCQLCENQILDAQFGSRCALTNDRPDFGKRCLDKRFEEKYEKRIREVNEEFEQVKSTKGSIITHVLTYGIISLGMMISGFVLLKFILEKGVFANVTLIIMGSGFLVIPYALGPWVKFKQQFQAVRKKKEELDEILELYNIQYTIDVSIKHDRHGTVEINSDLHFQKKPH